MEKRTGRPTPVSTTVPNKEDFGGDAVSLGGITPPPRVASALQGRVRNMPPRSRDTMRPIFANQRPKIRRAHSDPKRGAGRPSREGAGDLQEKAQKTPGARCTRSPCAEGSKHTVVTTGSPKTPGVF